MKPNQLTTIRLGLILPILISQQINTTISLIVCFALVICHEILDIADGRLARSTRQVTDFGKLYDPFVDSLCRFALFLGFFGSGWGVSLWMVYTLFARDITVAYVRVYAAHSGVIVAARWSGKYIKAIPQVLAQLVVLSAHLLKTRYPQLPAEQITYWSVFVATIFTAASGLDYICSVGKTINKRTH